jgi:ABC-type amino acid transport system permease subunit
MNFGTFTLLIGLTVVVSHPIFRGWPILVTLMGFLTILKGLLFLFFPHALSNILVVWQDKNMMMAPLPALILGLALIYFGFVRKH